MKKPKFKIRHNLSTGESGDTYADTLCEALVWFKCKASGKSVERRMITLFYNDVIIKCVLV